MIEPTNEPVAATGDQGETTEGNLLQGIKEERVCRLWVLADMLGCLKKSPLYL